MFVREEVGSLELGVRSFECGVWNLEFSSWNLGFGTWVLEFGIWDLGLGTSLFRYLSLQQVINNDLIAYGSIEEDQYEVAFLFRSVS
jgi:hypothetical protein